MRRNHSVLYHVNVPDHWYICKLRKWIHENDMEPYHGKYTISTFKFYENCKCLKKKWPRGTVISKIFWKKGICMETVYTYK